MKYPWIDEYLLAKAGVTKDHQKEWNWTGYMIGGKMFAAICLDNMNSPYYVTLNLPRLMRHAKEGDDDIIPEYYMNKSHRNSVKANGS